MLTSLLIRNYALIDRLELSPDAGLNIVTGETGAGKSIMLGALGLVMGARADTKALYHTGEKCFIEATFAPVDKSLRTALEAAGADYDPDACLLRREINPQGKSRAFINDTPVTLEALRTVADQLLDVHSQHDTLLLGSASYQLELLDAFAGLQVDAATVAGLVRAWRTAEAQARTLEEQIAAAARERDFNAFQLEELDKLAPQPNELEELEAELNLLENTQDIRLRLGQANNYVQGSGAGGEPDDALTRLKAASQQLDRVGAFSAPLAQLAQRLASLLLELKDVAAELADQAERIESDPERLQAAQERASQLNLQLKKHSLKTTAELITLKGTLAQALAGADGADEQLAGLRAQAAKTLKEATKQAEVLSKKRIAALEPLQNQVGTLLAEVGMPNARLRVEHSAAPLTHTGADYIRMLFSANKGVAPQELKSVASGGEFSRLMLCVKYVLAGKTRLPTLIFDEIDTGISGEIALRVARLMGQMAAKHQLIVITHMPQIAARGARHYYVFKSEAKERTYTNIRELAGPERLQEIAQMIGGANPSPTAVESARELMAAGR